MHPLRCQSRLQNGECGLRAGRAIEHRLVGSPDALPGLSSLTDSDFQGFPPPYIQEVKRYLGKYTIYT
jgi:hypothetical protein